MHDFIEMISLHRLKAQKHSTEQLIAQLTLEKESSYVTADGKKKTEYHPNENNQQQSSIEEGGIPNKSEEVTAN